MEVLAAAVWVAVDGGPNPILPKANELVSGLLGMVFLLVPIAIVTFVIWQVVLTRRAAERAADAAERTADQSAQQ